MRFNDFKQINEAQFNSKQEVIDHFVKQGKSAAQGAAAWERGWRGSAPKKKTASATRSYHDELDDKRYGEHNEDITKIEQALAEAALGVNANRPARTGSRPGRGHAAKPLYKSIPKNTNQDEKTLEWNELDQGLSVEDKMGIFEEYYIEGSLKESNSDDSTKYFSSLSKLSDPLVNGQDYIVVPLALVKDRVMSLGAPAWLTFTGRNGIAYVFNGPDGKIEYPSKQLRDSSVWETFIFSNNKSYDKFKTAISLKFDINLPDVEGVVNELQKDTLKRYVKAAGKDVEQRASSQSFKSGQAGDKYNKADPTHKDVRREKGIDRALNKLTREEMEAELEEWKASRKLCMDPSKSDDEIGASALSSCKSQGFRARDGKKSHKVGSKRITVGGKKIKGKAYGGPLPDYGTRK